MRACTLPRIHSLLLALAVVTSLWTLPALAQTEVLALKREAALRDGPSDTARAVATLPSQTHLTRLNARVGAWMQVRTDTGQSGWVHLFDVSTTTPSSSGAGNSASAALRSLGNLFNRGGASSTPVSTSTSTVGIRGLGAEDLAQAQPNLAAVTQAQAQRVDAVQARRFAAELQLTAKAVDPLPEPAAPSPTVTTPASARGR